MFLWLVSLGKKRKGVSYEAFQASISMKEAPKVPHRNPAASSPALFFGTPFGSSPIIKPAARIVGMIHSSIIDDLSLHLSEKWPTARTVMRPTAPTGAFKRRASRLEYPKVVSNILEKFESPPLGMAPKIVQRQTSQTRISLNVSKT